MFGFCVLVLLPRSFVVFSLFVEFLVIIVSSFLTFSVFGFLVVYCELWCFAVQF